MKHLVLYQSSIHPLLLQKKGLRAFVLGKYPHIHGFIWQVILGNQYLGTLKHRKDRINSMGSIPCISHHPLILCFRIRTPPNCFHSLAAHLAVIVQAVQHMAGKRVLFSTEMAKPQTVLRPYEQDSKRT